MSNIYRTILEEYIEMNPKESSKLSSMVTQISNEEEKNLINRKNFIGHFTSSGFIVNKVNKKVLLIHHKVLKKYLQPGGHIEIHDRNPLEASIREIKEETGINLDNIKYKFVNFRNKLIPFNISVHLIPENIDKKEKSHYHFDLQYLFFTDSILDINIDEKEVSGYEWIDWEIFKNMTDFKEISTKIEKVIQDLPELFLMNFIEEKNYSSYSCIAILHITKSSLGLIKILNNIFGNNLSIYAKPNSIDLEVWELLEKNNMNLKIAKRNLPNEVQYYKLNSKNKIILIDIGGYFSNVATIDGLSIVGIIEDTENGIQKYQKNLDSIKYPVYSVARNPLKRNEDSLVGKDIVFGADYILHQNNTLLQYMNVACIGYGKIGKGICSRLKEIGIKPVVLELNPIRAIEAICDGCDYLGNKNFENIDIIFCATGSRSLNIIDFRSVKNGTCFVSATSSDDEFDTTYLDDEYNRKEINRYILKYSNDKNFFYILNKGVPTNFAVGASLWNYILLVHAAILVSLNKLILGEQNDVGKIYELTDSENRKIASSWLQLGYRK